MTAEIKHILDLQGKADPKGKVGTQSTTDFGTEHPLWSILNAQIPPSVLWRSLKGSEREGVVRAGKILHEHNIPYSFYGDFLLRFGKAGFKRFPMSICGWKTKKDGSIPILQEFVSMVEYLKKVYLDCPGVLAVNDAVYKMYPRAHELGVMKFLYSVGLIADMMKQKPENEIRRILSLSTDIESFWNDLGATKELEIPFGVDLSAGLKDTSAEVQVLGREVQIRLGNVAGKANPALDRYFKKGGKLNVQGLKVVTGEKSL